jgi:hypothetical protein
MAISRQAAYVECCTFRTGRRTDFEVTPIRPTIVVYAHLSESWLRSIRRMALNSRNMKKLGYPQSPQANSFPYPV